MKVPFIFASLTALALAGCDSSADESQIKNMFGQLTAEKPVTNVSLDYSIVRRCEDPRDTADLIVRVPGSQSNIGKAYRRAGCVTLAVYDGEKSQIFEFGHFVRAFGHGENRDVIQSYDANERVIERTDFPSRNLSAAQISKIARSAY